MEQKQILGLSENQLLDKLNGLGPYLSPIRSGEDLDAKIKLTDQLLDLIGEAEEHALNCLLNLVSNQIEEYENKHILVPDVSGADALKFLMEQRDLKQTDLADIIPQSNLSAVLNGKRELTLKQISKLMKFFNLPADVFIP